MTQETLPVDKTFSQEQLDKIIGERLGKTKEELETTAKERDAIKESNKSLLSQLESLKESKNMTQKQKDELAEQIATLENTVLSKEEQALKKENELQTGFQKELETKDQESKVWRNLFQSSTIERALLDGATKSQAESADQIIQMYRPATELVEQKDEEGKTTGEFVSVTKFLGLNEEGKSTTLTLPTLEAIQKLREDGLNKNLFRHGQSAGTGGDGKTLSLKATDAPDPDKYTDKAQWHVDYKKWKVEQNGQ